MMAKECGSSFIIILCLNLLGNLKEGSQDKWHRTIDLTILTLQ